eukprot:4570735-Amphidinium_carterae.1
MDLKPRLKVSSSASLRSTCSASPKHGFVKDNFLDCAACRAHGIPCPATKSQHVNLQKPFTCSHCAASLVPILV